MLLNQTFITLLKNYSSDGVLRNELWNEIEKNYSGKNRHYHTLAHLENLLAQLSEIRNEIRHWNCILFTLYYHDIVYNSLKSDNEEKSAEFAGKRMKQLGIEESTIERCKKQIIATKSHVKSADSDTNYFTDADLSVLGQSWEMYSAYYKNVRKEYSIYPTSCIIPGVRKY
jgi:predicted metal-dependent HD superfamily phosphohydrolase